MNEAWLGLLMPAFAAQYMLTYLGVFAVVYGDVWPKPFAFVIEYSGKLSWLVLGLMLPVAAIMSVARARPEHVPERSSRVFCRAVASLTPLWMIALAKYFMLE